MKKTIVTIALLAFCSGHLHAAPRAGHSGKLTPDDFLDCGAVYAVYAYQMKANGSGEEAGLADLERRALFYVQIGDALAGSSLRNRFIETSEREMVKTEAMIKNEGMEKYLSYSEEREEHCRDLIRNNKDDITRIMNKFYDEQKRR
jgi:hypothetical protein